MLGPSLRMTKNESTHPGGGLRVCGLHDRHDLARLLYEQVCLYMNYFPYNCRPVALSCPDLIGRNYYKRICRERTGPVKLFLKNSMHMHFNYA